MTATKRWAGLAAVLAAALLAACGSDSKEEAPPLSVDVGATFPAGTLLRDHYSGRTVTVGGDGRVVLDPDPSGVVLLERDGAATTPFRWDAATVYFAMTDRFHNGNPANDGSYGRVGDGADEVGTWHGGDLAGLTAKLDHLEALGATAIWISPPVEQAHGWVSGGGGSFKHWGYAGYWALDFTRLDASFGTEEELRTLVDEAHARGIRVVLDVVMNHPGYATGADLLEYFPTIFKDGTGDLFRAYDAAPQADLDTWNDLVNYGDTDWTRWWSPAWIRAGLGGGHTTGSGVLEGSLSSLPDFKTETLTSAPLPPFLSPPGTVAGYTTPKADTLAVAIPDATVRDYLVAWHTRWVRDFGIDGFRCDTAKHVELASWKALEAAATAALAEWKAGNPAKKLDDLSFWSVAEVFPHGVVKDEYFTEADFDSVINFDFRQALQAMLAARPTLPESAAELEALYAGMATALNPDPAFDVMTYLSSHDTSLAFANLGYDAAKQRQAGTALLLAPGSTQIFYGDESGRRLGPGSGEAVQGTRSDMNWESMDETILGHWQKLGTFRRKHAAVGAGQHTRLDAPAGTYAFSRTLADGALDDAVVVVLTAPR